MLVGTVQKQPNDRFDIDVTFAKWLANRENDTIDTIGSTIEPAGLTNLGASHNGQRAKQWIAGGVSGATYKITLLANTIGGRAIEAEVRVRVRER